MTSKTGSLKRKSSLSNKQREVKQDEEENEGKSESESENEDLMNSIEDNDSSDSEAAEDSNEEVSDAEYEDVFDDDDESGSDGDNENVNTSDEAEESADEESNIESDNVKRLSGESDSGDVTDNEESPDVESVLKKKGGGNRERKDSEFKNEKDADSDAFNKKAKSKKNNKPTSTSVTTAQKDEYEHDTSDEEDIRNTVGNIPMQWYDDYSHLGYDWDGQRLIKPETGDQLDEFLKRMEDPNFWRTVKDPQTGQNVVLSDEDVNLIKRIQANKIPDETFDEYAPWIEWFTSEVMKTPVRKFPDHKRSFIPSRSEAQKVSKLVHALKMGWIKTREEQAKLKAKKDPQFYMLWQTDDTAEEMRRIHKHIPAPKRHLPGHAESYNPPVEYLFDKKEMKQWNKQKLTPSKRKLHFVPQKYASLREVPSYSRYIKERFLRCLDLYMAPRAIKMRLNIEPESLVPKLPNPKDLQPFPTVLSVEFEGHADMVRTMSCDTKGQYLITGSDDQTVKVWEVNTGRCLKTIELGDTVHKIAWCPNASLSLVAVAVGNTVYLINPGVGDSLVVSKTDSILQDPPQTDVIVADRVKTTVKWEQAEGEEWEKGIRIKLHHFKTVTQVTWHGRGDYFASVMPDGQNRSVLINQLSRRRSQLPFTKSKGLVQCVLFHPVRPYLFVATQRNVRIYDLVKQELVKKLLSNSKWISSMAIHSGGDNLLVGTYDRKMLWFDLDLSTKPYQTLRLHGTAVRGVAYHKRYPLFASGSDDRSLIVSHGMVYNDLLQNPLIVPLKRLCDHKPANDFGIFEVMFHPSQPWVFSAGADGTVKLYSN